MSKNNILDSFYKGIYRGLILSLIILIIMVLIFFVLPKNMKENLFTKNNIQQEANIGGNFELIGKEGKVYTKEYLLGKPSLIFFGFTYCPDICTYGLSNISDVLDYFGKEANKVNAVFITLDPERDNYIRTSEFVENFHSNIIGLSGSEEKIQEVVNLWRVYRKKIPLENSELDYTLDHSAYIYLMDKEGKYFTHFSHIAEPEDIVIKIQSLL